MVSFLAQVMNVDVKYQKENKIVIDERTGTVVAGINITVEPVVITHDNITIKIAPKTKISDDNKLGVNIKDGTSIEVNNNILNMKYGQITIANLTRALQKLGARPKDVISILEALKRAGSITAKLEII